MQTITLTLDLATSFLFAPNRLVMVIICANFFQIPPCITKLWVGHEQVSLKSMLKNKVRTVTLTSDLATWFLFATHRLVMIIICAKLFSNLNMHNKVMGRTRTGTTEV